MTVVSLVVANKSFTIKTFINKNGGRHHTISSAIILHGTKADGARFAMLLWGRKWGLVRLIRPTVETNGDTVDWRSGGQAVSPFLTSLLRNRATNCDHSRAKLIPVEREEVKVYLKKRQQNFPITAPSRPH